MVYNSLTTLLPSVFKPFCNIMKRPMVGVGYE